MNVLQTLQQKYIEEFSSNISIEEFLLNILIVALLITFLKWFYIRYGSSISNRRKFSDNFLPLSLATLLVIMIVKSSIALSLGLVGALSIVRFRAAIKEPEELTYLFIAIGIGLAGGANQPVLAVLTFTVIIVLLYLNTRLSKRKAFQAESKIYINIHSDILDLQKFTTILSDVLPYVALKRSDTGNQVMDMSFLCKADSLQQLETVQRNISSVSPVTTVSIVDVPDV